MPGCPSFRAFRETAGTFSKPRRGGCPHPPGWGLFSRSRRESAFTHLSFRGAPRLEPAFIYLSFRIRFSGEESAFCRAAPSFSRFLRKGGDLLKPRRRRCPHLPNTLPLSVVILRKRSPSPREGLPTKDLCIRAASEAETASLILPKGKRRETPSVSPPRSLTYLSFRGAPRREPGFKYLSFRIRFSGEESAFCRGCPILSRFLRKGGDFFRAAEQNLPSHTCHSEERRDESLLSNTCHSESALAVRNLLLRKPPGVPQGLAAFARPGMSKLSLASHQPKLAIGFSGVGIRCSRRGTR